MSSDRIPGAVFPGTPTESCDIMCQNWDNLHDTDVRENYISGFSVFFLSASASRTVFKSALLVHNINFPV